MVRGRRPSGRHGSPTTAGLFTTGFLEDFTPRQDLAFQMVWWIFSLQKEAFQERKEKRSDEGLVCH